MSTTDSFNFKSEVSQNTGNFTPLPVNRYDLIVNSAEATLSKEKKTPQIAITFGVLNNDALKNRKVFHNFTWTKAASPFVYNFMKVVKSALVDEDNVTIEKVAADLVGKRVSAFIDVETTNSGSNRNKASDWKEYTGPVAGATTGTTSANNTGSGAPAAGTALFK